MSPSPAAGVANQAAPFERLLALCQLSDAELPKEGWERLLLACERICLEAVLARSRTQKEAAEALGLTPTKMHRLLRKHGIAPGNGENAEPGA